MQYKDFSSIVSQTVILFFALFCQETTSFTPQPAFYHDPVTRLGKTKIHHLMVKNHDDCEPYIGPISSLTEMEGGIAISENALQVLVGPSLVAPGRGLFLSIFNEDIESDELVEEVVIPHGTPLCGYGRGYFTSEETGDKSVSFTFTSDTVVFFEKELMGISDAIQLAYDDHDTNDRGIENGAPLGKRSPNELLWGHIVEFDAQSGGMLSIKPDEDFDARIFVPDDEDDEQKFGPPRLGMYANDLAYDPDAMNEKQYLDKSNENNILQLVWRLAKDEKTGLLVPTWPVVVARKDFRLVNTVPMEVGLQYGYQYWKSFTGHPEI